MSEHILLTCSCGKRLKIDAAHRGKKGKCPVCQRVIQIPESTTAQQVQTATPAGEARSPGAPTPRVAPPSSPQGQAAPAGAAVQATQPAATGGVPSRTERIFDPAYANPGGPVPDLNAMSPGQISQWVADCDVIPSNLPEVRELARFSYLGTYGDPIPFRVSLFTSSLWYLAIGGLVWALLMLFTVVSLGLWVLFLAPLVLLGFLEVCTATASLEYLRRLRQARAALAAGRSVDEARREALLPLSKWFVLLSVPKLDRVVWGTLMMTIYLLLQSILLLAFALPGICFFYMRFFAYALALAACVDRGLNPLQALAFGKAVMRKVGGTGTIFSQAPLGFKIEVILFFIFPVWVLWDLAQFCEGMVLGYAWLLGLEERQTT